MCWFVNFFCGVVVKRQDKGRFLALFLIKRQRFHLIRLFFWIMCKDALKLGLCRRRHAHSRIHIHIIIIVAPRRAVPKKLSLADGRTSSTPFRFTHVLPPSFGIHFFTRDHRVAFTLCCRCRHQSDGNTLHCKLHNHDGRIGNGRRRNGGTCAWRE